MKEMGGFSERFQLLVKELLSIVCLRMAKWASSRKEFNCSRLDALGSSFRMNVMERLNVN